MLQQSKFMGQIDREFEHIAGEGENLNVWMAANFSPASFTGFPLLPAADCGGGGPEAPGAHGPGLGGPGWRLFPQIRNVKDDDNLFHTCVSFTADGRPASKKLEPFNPSSGINKVFFSRTDSGSLLSLFSINTCDAAWLGHKIRIYRGSFFFIC